MYIEFDLHPAVCTWQLKAAVLLRNSLKLLTRCVDVGICTLPSVLHGNKIRPAAKLPVFLKLLTPCQQGNQWIQKLSTVSFNQKKIQHNSIQLTSRCLMNFSRCTRRSLCSNRMFKVSASLRRFAQSKLLRMTPSWGHRRVLGLWLLVPPDIWRMKAQVLKERIPINFLT